MQPAAPGNDRRFQFFIVLPPREVSTGASAALRPFEPAGTPEAAPEISITPKCQGGLATPGQLLAASPLGRSGQALPLSYFVRMTNWPAVLLIGKSW